MTKFSMIAITLLSVSSVSFAASESITLDSKVTSVGACQIEEKISPVDVEIATLKIQSVQKNLILYYEKTNLKSAGRILVHGAGVAKSQIVNKRVNKKLMFLKSARKSALDICDSIRRNLRDQL